MKRQSRRLENWGSACTVVGVFVLAAGIIAALVGAGVAGDLILSGIGLLISGPVLSGLAILVVNAEEQIDEREDARSKSVANENNSI